MGDEFVIYDLPSTLSEDELVTLVEDLEDEFGDLEIDHANHSLVDQSATEQDRGGFGFEGATALGLSLNILMLTLEARDRQWHEKFIQRIQTCVDDEDSDPTYETADPRQVAADPAEWFGSELWGWLPEESHDKLSEAGRQFVEGAFARVVQSNYDAVTAVITQRFDGISMPIWPDGAESLREELPISMQSNVTTNLDFLWSQRQTALTEGDEINRDDAIAALFVTKRTLNQLHQHRS